MNAWKYAFVLVILFSSSEIYAQEKEATPLPKPAAADKPEDVSVKDLATHLGLKSQDVIFGHQRDFRAAELNNMQLDDLTDGSPEPPLDGKDDKPTKTTNSH